MPRSTICSLNTGCEARRIEGNRASKLVKAMRPSKIASGEPSRSQQHVYTDDLQSYRGLPFEHESVRHSVSEYVRDQAHVNGLALFWAGLKRGYHRVYQHVSPKHLERYVNEFSVRHRDRPSDTVIQMENMAQGMTGKQMRYKDLTAGGPQAPAADSPESCAV